MLPLMSDSLALPITQTARNMALEFGRQQSTPEKAQQVYLNTLAIWAVKNYLDLMDIAYDLEGSDSWNPVVRLCADVADLVVSGIGRLECRPIAPHEVTCSLPPEVWSDRIGYLLVMINDEQRQASLLGFTPSAIVGNISLNQLQPLESLLAHLSEFMPALASPPALVGIGPCIDLGQWLQGVFDRGWQQVGELLQYPNPELAFNFRSATTSTLDLDAESVQIERAKLVQFKDDATDISLVLIMNLLQTEIDGQRMIRVQLRPSGHSPYLPNNLVLRILDAQKTTFLEAQSRFEDNYLQLQFSGSPAEQFHLSLEQGNQTITETFVLGSPQHISQVSGADHSEGMAL